MRRISSESILALFLDGIVQYLGFGLVLLLRLHRVGQRMDTASAVIL